MVVSPLDGSLDTCCGATWGGSPARLCSSSQRPMPRAAPLICRAIVSRCQEEHQSGRYTHCAVPLNKASSLRYMRAASGARLTGGRRLCIVPPPTRHSLTPPRATPAHDTRATPLTESSPRHRWSLYGVVPWFPAPGAARRGMFWAPDPGADHCMRAQSTLGEHGAASSAGAARICLYSIVWRHAHHTQEDTMKQAVRRGLWWGGLLSL